MHESTKHLDRVGRVTCFWHHSVLDWGTQYKDPCTAVLLRAGCFGGGGRIRAQKESCVGYVIHLPGCLGVDYFFFQTIFFQNSNVPIGPLSRKLHVSIGLFDVLETFPNFVEL